VPLTRADLASLNDEARSEGESEDTLIDNKRDASSSNPLSSKLESSNTSSSDGTAKSERIIVGNLTKDQSLMICGPIGEDLWARISCVEVKENTAEGNSTMVAYATSLETLNALMDRQDKRIEAGRKERERMRRHGGAN
jgi:hypothetical protein